MDQHTIETLLDLTADIARHKVDIPYMDIPIALAKLQRLAASLHRRYDEGNLSNITIVLEDKALRLAQEMGMELEIFNKIYRPFRLVFNGKERWM